MTRFILVSFAFLGWGYYELSGGADFEPGWHLDDESHAVTTLTAPSGTAAEAPAPVAGRVAQGSDTAAPPVRAAPEDPEAVVQLASLPSASVTAPAARAPQGTARIGDVWLTRREAVDVAIPAPEPGEPVAFESESVPDMRAVAGSRVNLRNGPGTRHSVVAKLTRGTPVEVLRAEGGWLKVRVADNRRIGWMADYLVTAAAE